MDAHKETLTDLWHDLSKLAAENIDLKKQLGVGCNDELSRGNITSAEIVVTMREELIKTLTLEKEPLQPENKSLKQQLTDMKSKCERWETSFIALNNKIDGFKNLLFPNIRKRKQEEDSIDLAKKIRLDHRQAVTAMYWWTEKLISILLQFHIYFK